MCPRMVAPHSPTIVLFEPTVRPPVPVSIVPVTWTTAGLEPATAVFSAESVLTVTVGPAAPPVVPPETVAQPTSSLGAGGVVQSEPPPLLELLLELLLEPLLE